MLSYLHVCWLKWLLYACNTVFFCYEAKKLSLFFFTVLAFVNIKICFNLFLGEIKNIQNKTVNKYLEISSHFIKTAANQSNTAMSLYCTRKIINQYKLEERSVKNVED